MEIKENLTTRNYTAGNNRSIKYIVIHYVGAVSTAKNNADYFKSTYRGASAHYFVDENDIYRVVADKDVAWHCGTTGKYYHNSCRNSNSIGIEMCCYKNNGTLDVSDKVVERTIELTKELMAKYGISASNVVRHYDVTHKNCPAPFVSDSSRWTAFLSKLNGTTTTTTTTTAKKSVEEIANEVIAGKWGNGDDRKNKLTSAGYDYSAVQSKVNEILTGKKTTTTKTATANTSSGYALGLYVVNTAKGLNVRNGPGQNYKILKAYTNGTRFDTYQISGEWAKTPSGWVCLKYCKLVKKY